MDGDTFLSALGQFMREFGFPATVAVFLLYRLDATLRKMAADYTAAIRELSSLIDTTERQHLTVTTDVTGALKDIHEGQAILAERLHTLDDRVAALSVEIDSLVAARRPRQKTR